MANDGGGGGRRGGSGRELDISDFDAQEGGPSLELDAPHLAAGHAHPHAPGQAPPSRAGQGAPPPAPPPQPGGSFQAPYPPHYPPGPVSSSGMLAAPPPSLSSGSFPEGPPSSGMLPQNVLPLQPPPHPVSPPRPAPPLKPRRPRRHELTPAQRAAWDLAEYGDPPEQFWLAPVYAARVLMRKQELRHELVEARQRSPEQARLYEDALNADDAPTVKMGVILAVAALCLLAFLAALPVAIRLIKLALYGG